MRGISWLALCRGEALWRAVAEPWTDRHRLMIETHGHHFHVECDPQVPATAMGQWVFFRQFPTTGGMLSE